MTDVPVFTGRHVLYRLVDADRRLLYIGITKSVGRRFDAHAKSQPWWPEVADCRVEFFPDRDALEAAESAAIKSERPRYNVVHNREGMQVRRLQEELEAHWGATPRERMARYDAIVAEAEEDIRVVRAIRNADVRALIAEHGPTKTARMTGMKLCTVKAIRGQA